MMHGPEKSDSVIVAGKPTNKAERSAAELGAKGRDRGECGPIKHALDSEPDKRDTGCWLAYGNIAAVDTRGGSRMRRESRTYGSVRGGAQQ